MNPARSLGVALFAGPAALGQVWLFLLAPALGAVLAGISYVQLFEPGRRTAPAGAAARSKTPPIHPAERLDRTPTP